MAEAILFNIAEGILGELTSQAVKALFQEIGLLTSVEDEACALEGTISTVKAVLLDAEEKQAKNNQLKDWLRKLKDAVYDADDVLDDISTEALRRQLMAGSRFIREVSLFFSNSNQLACAFKMSRKVKTIKERLDKIAADRQKFQLEVRQEESHVVSRKREHTHAVMREVIVGREKDKEAVIDLLLNSDVTKKLSVIPIIGIGGLGKTALAQYVFNDEKVKNHFDMRIWTCVSDSFNIEILVKRILESIIQSKVEELPLDTLVSKLRREIDGKKFLLVLDDVWNEDREKWLNLEDTLKVGASGCKILVTARADRVANSTTATSLYRLTSLTEEKSWSLFKHVAFDKNQESKNLINIGKEVVKKCNGIPLVIRTIGNLLYHQKTESKWLKFKNVDLQQIDQEGDNKIFATLSLSYIYLPSHLKQCFAYCSLFPKDYEIDVPLLIKIWMAQGFIRLSNQLHCLEEVGYEYFVDLYERGFFQEMKSVGEQIVKCKMHDLIHDLATNVAGTECKTLNIGENEIDEKCRHVSLNFMLGTFWEIPTQFAKTKYLRTFLLPKHNKDFWRAGPSKTPCIAICSWFKTLRVLDLHNLDITVVPKAIGKLKHLRYLDLSYNDFHSLPNSLSKLQNLQTLNVTRCYGLQKLPKDFRKLVDLRHLEMDDCYDLKYMPRGLGCLTSLQTLPVFVVDPSKSKRSSNLSQLRGLNNLTGMLEIRNLGHGLQAQLDFEAANLREKRGLQKLKLRWQYTGVANNNPAEVKDEAILESLSSLSHLNGSEIRGYMGLQFPRWMMNSMESCLPNLREITLNRCYRCRRLPLFERLPHLRSLDVSGFDLVEHIDERNIMESTSDAFFPSLETLSLVALPLLKGWWRGVELENDGPSFPCLSQLTISDCPELRSIPLGSHTLKELCIGHASKEMLEQLLNVPIHPVSSPSSVTTSISGLEVLEVRKIDGLNHLPEEWLKNLTSLKKLKFLFWYNLKSIPNLSGLTSLKSLVIRSCDALKSLPPGVERLPFLEEITLDDCFEEVDIPGRNDENNMPFKSLRRLKFSQRQASSLPDWLGNLTMLRDLEICWTSKLETLPEWMEKLTSLQRLHIYHCPKLAERLRKRDGEEDWKKIAHIPYIEIEGDVIKQRGR